jgi:hypothetical protein
VARIRTIKPEFFRHEGLQELGAVAMLAFAGIWTQCDRAGRFRWDPKQLKLDVLPFMEFDMTATMELLRERRYIVSYEVEGRKYGYVPSWLDHQHINVKEPQSKIPAPLNAVPQSDASGSDTYKDGVGIFPHGAKPVQECGERELERDGERAAREASVPRGTEEASRTAREHRVKRIKAILAGYPVQIGVHAAAGECDEAVTRLELGELGGMRMSADEALLHIERQVKAFARSPEGTSGRAPNPVNFFSLTAKGCSYRDQPEAWSARANFDAVRGKPNGAAVGRELPEAKTQECWGCALPFPMEQFNGGTFHSKECKRKHEEHIAKERAAMKPTQAVRA